MTSQPMHILHNIECILRYCHVDILHKTQQNKVKIHFRWTLQIYLMLKLIVV